MKYSLHAFGSILEITLSGDSKNDSGISESFLCVEKFEKNYSRFLKSNTLSDINTWVSIEITPEIKSLIELSNKVSTLTQGHFDITLMPLLENAWYWISNKRLEEYIGYKNIYISGNRVCLKNGVQIEFGSCGKWYMLDVVYNILKIYHDEFVINFGWDMRIKGNKTILLEDSCDTTKNIGAIDLTNLAIASSSWNKRKFGDSHHLVDVVNGRSQDDKIAVYVTHKLWVFADIFATALFVTPIELSLKVLEKVTGLEALIIWADGRIYKSKWCNITLNI